MCGIAGMVGLGANSPSAEIMAQAIAHRGPDGAGVWHARNVAFAHRRLAIIDISGGNQPMISASGRWVLVFNGEIYNFRDLRRDSLRDYPFCTQSDTEVILAGLDKWGEGVLQRLEGMFALAAYDMRSKRVLLARDGQGIKPLYYTRLTAGCCLFGSEVAALRAGGYQVQVDEDALDIFLDIRFVPSPNTLFKNVWKLRPGHFVWISSDGAISDQKAFAPNAPAIDRKMSLDSRISNLRDALLSGVERQLVADVPVGVLLSGGVDSAAVAAAAVSAGSRVSTFCVGYEDEHWSNEFAEAKESARLLGTEHHELRISSAGAIDSMSSLIGHLEEPVVTTSLFSYYLLCEAVAKHRKVVLSGQGADEPWGGYGRHRVAALAKWIMPLVRVLPKDLSILRRHRESWRRLSEALSSNEEIARWMGFHALFPHEERCAIRPAGAGIAKSKFALERNLAFLPNNATDLERMLALETRTSLPDNLLMLGDKLSMAWGLEVRVPLLDPTYLRLVESTPGYLRRGGIFAHDGKYLHKRVCQSLLPKEIVHRPKKGFQSPIEEWLKLSLGTRLTDMIEEGNSFTRSFLNLKEARKLIADHCKGQRGNLERQLFAIWALEEWHQHYFRQ